MGLLVMVLAALEAADGKGGGGFRSSSVRTSSVRRSSAQGSSTARTQPSTNPYYRGHPEPSRSCIGCYYAGGMYYDRTFMFLYLGMAHRCVSCTGRSSVDVDSLHMSLPAITAVADINLNRAWYTNEVLTTGSSEFASFAAELSDVISELTGGTIPPTSCLITGFGPRRGFAQAMVQHAEFHVEANVTILLEAEGADPALVVDSLQTSCVVSAPTGGPQLGHWLLPHCLTGLTATTVQLTSALGDSPIPVRETQPSGGISFGDMLLSMLMLALVAWGCASYAERRAEFAMREPSHHPARGARGYDQLRGCDRDDSDDSDGGGEQVATERLKLFAVGGVVDAHPVVHAVAVRATSSSGNASGQDVSPLKQRDVTAGPGLGTVSTGFQ